MTQAQTLPLALLLLAMVSLVVFSPCLQNGFVNWDDPLLVTNNPEIQQPSWKNIRRVFSFEYAKTIHQYHPLVFLSFMLEHHLAGLNPRLYHLTNILLHLLNTLLVFWLVHLLLHSIPFSLIVSLIFAVHPLHVQSVAWVSERKDLLYSLFFLAALVLYVLYSRRRRAVTYLLALLCFMLSLLCKSMAVTLPAVLVLIDHLYGRLHLRRSWLEKIPFLIPAAGFTAINLVLLGTAEMNTLDPPPVSFLERLASLGYGLFFLLKKFFVPYPLAPRYPRFDSPVAAPSLPFLAFVLLLLILAVLYAVKIRGSRLSHFGLLFFCVTVSPVAALLFLGFPPFDHYFYLPMFGLILTLCVLAREWTAGLPAGHRHRRTILLLLLIFVVADLSYLSLQRCRVWKTTMHLWNDTLRHYPTHVAYNNRGLARVESGDLEAAVRDFSRALRLHPHYEVYYNRARALQSLGRLDTARSDYDAALRIKPDYPPALNNRGRIFANQGDVRRAILDFTAALRQAPSYTTAWINRAAAFQKAGNPKQALADLSAALGQDPESVEALYHRGLVHITAGDYTRARLDLDDVIRRRPDHVEARYNRGIIRELNGEGDGAERDFTQALRFDPGFLPAYARLFDLYGRGRDPGLRERLWVRLARARPDIIFLWLKLLPMV